MLVFSKQVALKLLIHPYNQEIKLHKRVYDHMRRLNEEKGKSYRWQPKCDCFVTNSEQNLSLNDVTLALM